MRRQFTITLIIFSKCVLLVQAQDPTEMDSILSDALAEVITRRPRGVQLANRAATVGLVTLGVRNTNIETTASFGPGPVVHNPVSIHAKFSKRREAPDVLEAVGAAADTAATATAMIISRSVGTPWDPETFKRMIAPFCPVRKVNCNPRYPYRTADGSCNNLLNPLWGASITPQRRFVPPAYGDGANCGAVPRILSITGYPLPSPRVISNSVHNGGMSPPRSSFYNVALTHFGQFIDHDVISTPLQKDNGNDINCCMGDNPVIRPACFSFNTPRGEFNSTCMSFVRSDIAVDPGCPPGTRNQANQRTSYLDLSVLYGNTDQGVADSREPGTGRLRESFMRLLPNGGTDCVDEVCFTSGDQRMAEIPMLTVFHIIFLREHNNIVEGLRALGWKDGESLFQEARKILTGIYQHIVYTEFLPAVLGQQGMKMFGLRNSPFGFCTSYDSTVDASTRNSFGAAAYRFGHSLIGSLIGSSNVDFSIVAREPLETHFLSTRAIRDFSVFGADGIGRWMTSQFNGMADRFLTPAVRNRLFQTQPGNGFDLASLNIQRGRDHGLPSYNRFRAFCGLRPALYFGVGVGGLVDHDFSAAQSLASIYRHPEDIDLFAGGLSERVLPGALVGPTFRCLIGLQFKLYKTGDRFFYENYFVPTGFTADQLQQIKSQTMSALYCRTLNVRAMSIKAFVSPLGRSNRIPCQFFSRLDFRAWRKQSNQRNVNHEWY